MPSEIEDVDYEEWAISMCTLLDAIEKALRDHDIDRAKKLVMGRFDIMEKHGLEIISMGIQTNRIQ